MKQTLKLCALLTFVAFALWGTDINGKWTAVSASPVSGPSGRGQVTQTFVFKVSGATLTGTRSGPLGDSAISDGRISDDTFTFSVTGPTGRKIQYKGKINNDNSISLTIDDGRGGEQNVEMRRATP